MRPTSRPESSRLIGEMLFEDVLLGLLRNDHFALVGPPRAGKSIIIDEIVRRVGERGGAHRPTIVKVTPAAFGELGGDSLLSEFASRLGADVPAARIARGTLSESLLHLIRTRVERVPGRVIFVMHQIHALSLHQAREVLSAFAQCWHDERLRDRVAVIVTGAGDFTAMVQSANSPYRFATRYSIEGMDHDFSRQFFLGLVQHGVAEEAFDILYDETSGSPMLIEDIVTASMRSAVRARRSSGYWDRNRIRHAIDEYLDDFMDENIVVRTMLRDIENREHEFAKFLEVLRSGDGEVHIDPVEGELARESDLFFPPKDGSMPPGMQHPPIPFLVVSGAVVRDARRRAYISSPLLRRFCERRYTAAHVGDVYSGLRRWDQAWSEYEQWHDGSVLRPIFGVSRFRVEDVLVDWGNSFHEAAVNGIDVLIDRFLNGARYLLHFKDLGIWNLSDPTHLEFPLRGDPRFKNEILALPEYQGLGDCADPKRPGIRRSEDCSTVLAVIACDGEISTKLLLGLKRHEPDGEVDTRTFRIIRRALTTFASALNACLKDQYAETLGRAANAHQHTLHRAHELLARDPVDVNEVLDGVCQTLVDQGYYRILVCLVDPTGQRIDGTNEKSTADAVSLGAETHYLLNKPEEDVQPHVVATKEYYVIADGSTDPRANRELCKRAGVSGACIVPMRIGDQVVGTLHFERGDRAPPHKSEAELFQVFADELALIVREGQRMTMLTTALDGVEDPIAFTDVLGNAIYLNRRASEIVGRNPGWQSGRESLAPQFDPGSSHHEFASRFDLVEEQKDRVTRYWAPLTNNWASAVAWQGHIIYRHNGVPAALVERFQDLSVLNNLVDVINRAAAVSEPRQRARVYLKHLRNRGYGKPRFYLADISSGRRVLKSFAAVDFADPERLQQFEDGGVVKSSDSPDAWLAIDQRETLILHVDPGLDAQGLPQRIVREVPEEGPLRGERSTPWIDIPLWEGDSLVGKISVNYPPEFTPERWQYLKLFAGKIAASIQAAIRERQHEMEIERNLAIARMLSHRMDASMRRCLLACEKLNKVVPPTAAEAPYLRLLRNRTLSTQVLIEHLLAPQESHPRQFDPLDLVELLRDVAVNAEFDVSEWKRARNSLQDWDCQVLMHSEAESIRLVGARHLLMNAFDNLVSNAINAMATKHNVANITLLPSVQGTDCVTFVSHEGPPLDSTAQRDYIDRICRSSGRLEDLITIQSPTTAPQKPGRHGLGLKIAAWIIKGIHHGDLRLTSEGTAAPCFQVTLPLGGRSPATEGRTVE